MEDVGVLRACTYVKEHRIVQLLNRVLDLRGIEGGLCFLVPVRRGPFCASQSRGQLRGSARGSTPLLQMWRAPLRKIEARVLGLLTVRLSRLWLR